jgi:hypothetical protein
MTRASLAVSILALLSSCGAEMDDPADTSAVTEAHDQIHELQRGSCDLLARCILPLRTAVGPARTELSDIDLDPERCGANSSFFDDIRESVAARRLVFHPERLADCVQEHAARECNQISVMVGACAEAFESTLDVGDVCSFWFDCGEHAFCDTLTPAATCPPTCAARKGAGEACAGGDSCVDGLRCYDPQLRQPPVLTCNPPGAEGENCQSLSCDEGLVCEGDSTTMRMCAPLSLTAQAGEACSTHEQCADGAACRGEPATGGPICVAESARLPCTQASECGWNEFCACTDATCMSHVCAPWPEAGEPCLGGLLRREVCASGTQCVAGTCEEGRPEVGCTE